MTLDDFRKEARSQGYAEPVKVRQPAGYHLDGHDHPFDAFALITLGQIDIGLDGVVTSYRPGDVFYLARGTRHAESAVGQGVVYWAARRHISGVST